MKNQYFGDINDYKKYALLRLLSGEGAIRTAVCWLLTDADNRSDGQSVGYLQEAGRWRAFDPALFDALACCLASPENRHVGWAKTADLIPAAVYYDAPLADDASRRRDYFERFLAFARGSDLVFFDPDNGLEVLSKPYGKRGSNRYLYWDELSRAFAAGHSILVYQHFPRVERTAFMQILSAELCGRTGAAEIFTFRTANVVFLLIPQQRHLAYLRERSAQVERVWGQHMGVIHQRCDERRGGVAEIAYGTAREPLVESAAARTRAEAGPDVAGPIETGGDAMHAEESAESLWQRLRRILRRD